ncbi:MAG: 4'-phosphopantetheinyl transferase superfamily protein [Magnetospirillum sp.]|nr:4'-phosphopantetheinyl transferase superfamily protein [Magnetospirillum sp.]
MPQRVWIWTLPVTAQSRLPWPELEAVLDPEEQARAARFQSPLDRQAYVAAHALGRFLLSSVVGGDPGQWRFVADQQGKPEVVWSADAPRPRLNLSHTRGLVAAALTLDHDVGIDVESLDRRVDGLTLAKRFFSAAEHQALLGGDPDRLKRDFLCLWTLKEAVVKANGKGMARQMSAFTVTLDPLGVDFAEDGAGQWLLRQWILPSGHVMALALGHPDPSRVGVTCRHVEQWDQISFTKSR